ncbi:ribonuclease H-like domain-containing protein [Mycena olivaceomarginata]|nr:ribonuclease H-like domain-containing protein [Mycena olivaceomarginata]
MPSTTNTVFVDNISLLHSCLTALGNTTSIAVDLEGVALCRSGILCIMQLKASESDTVWLVDIVTLRASAFDVIGTSGKSLRAMLESHSIKKLFFDVRNDSDALFNLFGVALANVYDLQLLEVAVRSSNPGVSRPTESPRRRGGGSLHLSVGVGMRSFKKRPLAPALVTYCAQDVALLHELEVVLHQRIGPRGKNWEQRVRAESAVRVGVARRADYAPNGKNKARVPKDW